VAQVKVRYIGDEPRDVSILPSGDLRRLEPDELFEVDEKVVASYECQPALYDVSEPSSARKGGK
jgi:hypothetical protein